MTPKKTPNVLPTLKPLKAWAIIDTRLPKPRWTFHRSGGEKIGLLALYDRKPTVPPEWKKFKKIVRVLIAPL